MANKIRNISKKNTKMAPIIKIQVLIHTKYEVSMTIYITRIVNKRNVLKWLSFKNYMSK